jgi:AraC-like DNA-binding protein
MRLGTQEAPLASIDNDNSSFVSRRRRVDWPLLEGVPGPHPPAPKVVERPIQAPLAALLSALGDVVALESPDAILRRAVEVAHEKIGLVRAAIFMLDRARQMMLGTWGADLQGAILDQHRITFALSDFDREAFRRARDEGAPFTVFDDCPIVEHRGHQTRKAGRGWVAWTPISSAHGPIGVLINDAALSGAPVDSTQQAHAAILCALLGTILDPARGLPGTGGLGKTRRRRVVTAAVDMLAENPSADASTIAGRLEVGVSWFARVFKAELGMSLVEYRNRLRLDRVDALLEQGRTTLLRAAKAAGFGSYAQFHRVFREIRGMTPRRYLQHRR